LSQPFEYTLNIVASHSCTFWSTVDHWRWLWSEWHNEDDKRYI